jgi:quinol monooxygenase YgiN
MVSYDCGPRSVPEWTKPCHRYIHPNHILQIIMPHVLIIHEVEDYRTWKQVFDTAAGMRKEAGERTYQVLQDERDANKVVHFSSWESLEAAKHFFESPKLMAIRQEAGIKAPQFHYLQQVDTGIL